nr:MAG TPA: hypothetical protein [Caudoviricetes sp.]
MGIEITDEELDKLFEKMSQEAVIEMVNQCTPERRVPVKRLKVVSRKTKTKKEAKK